MRRRSRWPLGRFMVCAALCAFLAACKVPLHTGLNEAEANEMLSKLLEYSIDASKKSDKDNRITLMVEESQFAQAVELLQSLGLPRRKYETMGDVFTGDGLVTSPVQEWARFNFALSQELSSMVSSIPGVISAQVHIANPRKQTPFEEAPPPSASVLVLVARDAITAELVPQIKQLVSYSVEKIDYERVGVVISPVDTPSAPKMDLVALGGVIMQRSSKMQALVVLGGMGLLGAIVGAGGMFAIENLLKGRRKEAA